MLRRLVILLASLALTVSASAQQPPASQSFPSYVLGKSLATVPLGSADYVPVIQGGVTRRVRGTDIGGGGSGITGTFGDSTHVPQCTFANGSATLCTNVLITGGSGTGANPTATASDVAVNGAALTFMRSDAAPAVQKGTNAAFGLVKCDGVTITCSGGLISSLTGGAGTVTNLLNLTNHAPVVGDGGTVGIKTTAAMTNGQLLVGVTGADPAPQTVSGDGTLSTGGALVITKTNGTSLTALSTTIPGTGVATFLATPSSANLAGALTDETGTGAAVFGTNPVLVTPNLGTPSAVNLSAAVGLPLTTGVTGTLPIGSGGTGTGTMTANALVKGNGTSPFTAAALSDDGTKISTSEPLDLTSKTLEREVANAGSTGTTLNKLAKLTGAPSTAVITATTDTDGAIGVVTGGAGTTSNARIALAGQASCVFDGSTTAGDFVIISPSVAGDCRDGGSTRPTGAQTIGRVTSTNGAGGTFVVDLDLGFANTAGGAGIVVSGTTAGTANAQTMPASFSFLDGNVVVAKIGAALTNTGPATLNVNLTGVKTVAAQDATGALSALVGGQLSAGGTYALVAHTSCPAPISADCYTIMTTPASGVTKDAATHTVAQNEWSNWWIFDYTANATLTLPVATNLATSGGLFIKIDANATLTLTPNSADGINGGTVNTSITLTGPLTTAITTTGASGVNAIQVPVPVSLNMAQSFTKGQAVTPVALTDAATVAVDASLSNGFTVTLGGNRTLGNPSNLLAGQFLEFQITQDGGGSKTLAYGNQYKFAGGTAPTLTTTASAIDVLSCWAATSSRLNCQILLDVK